MKKLLILSLLGIFSTGYTFAQKDADAKAILSKVSAKYKMYDGIKTDFTFTLDNPQAGIKETQTGTLVARSKANKFRVTLYTPQSAGKQDVAQEIISDGKTQWTFLKKDNEVQVSNVDNSGDGLNPAKIFTIYEHGYKYLYTGEKKISGNIYQEIDLTPEDDKKGFFKVRLEIDKAKKQIYSALIFDKNGNRYTYTIKRFAPNTAVADNTFSFDTKAHKGVEVVDLR
ncbi:LolA family protein [Mucilaginibacter xinganensis]|uniref:Outer membrane lipoprotein-sorting protein n=1 Tax=Mucilaginibacter xinganensis TaxID=1234841 RepID=A0A223NUG5_9SPHI|nr:outer membrane lipoprotein carrier protein LolA [Mucilaginibacter xinganensis]ASU33507.1 Outer membrane lipoprotein-sorting protein [Mucilaginibacter xinganensis]